MPSESLMVAVQARSRMVGLERIEKTARDLHDETCGCVGEACRLGLALEFYRCVVDWNAAVEERPERREGKRERDP